MRTMTLNQLIKQLQRKVRATRSNSQRRTLSLAYQCRESWGDVSIPEETGPRHAVAEAIAFRIAKPAGFVKERLDRLSRSGDYEQERTDRTLENPDSPVGPVGDQSSPEDITDRE